MGVILRAHPVRGESYIQRNANGEVAKCCYILLVITNSTNGAAERSCTANNASNSWPKNQKLNN